MPLVRISFRAGKSTQYRQAVADEVHRALVEAASAPELDRFQVLTEPAPGDLISLVGVAPEDWSFGEGKAQYVKAD